MLPLFFHIMPSVFRVIFLMRVFQTGFFFSWNFNYLSGQLNPHTFKSIFVYIHCKMITRIKQKVSIDLHNTHFFMVGKLKCTCRKCQICNTFLLLRQTLLIISFARIAFTYVLGDNIVTWPRYLLETGFWPSP